MRMLRKGILFFSLCLLYFLFAASVEAKEASSLRTSLKESEGSLQENLSENLPESLPKNLEGNLQEELQEAIARGDQKKIKEITTALTKKMANPKAKDLKKMFQFSLNLFQKMSPQELRELIQKRFTFAFAQKAFEIFPKILDFFVNLLQDPIALIQLVDIVGNRTRLIIFFILNVLIFIVAKIVKRSHRRKAKGLGTALGRWVFFTGLRFILLLAFFHVELAPLFSVLKRTFL